mgnify:CR=1 FL=1
MWEQVEQILRQATIQIAQHVADFLPGLLVALVLMVAAFVVAFVARMLVARALRGLDFDHRAEQLGLSALMGWSAAHGLSQSIARVFYWGVLVLGLLVGLTALNASIPSRLANAVFEYLPHLLAALMITVVGTVTARFLSRSVLIGAVNMQMHSARLLSLAVKWMVILVAVAMALDHLGIGRSVLLLAFGIFFGGVVFAAALAVGLGARDTVSRALDADRQEPRRRDNSVDHV